MICYKEELDRSKYAKSIVQFQKISILPYRRDWNFLGVGGFVRPKNLKKCMKLIWNFQRGGGWGVRENPFRGGGMDIFWNYTLHG